AKSVFEKLEIAPLAEREAVVAVDQAADFRNGFDRNFVSFAFPEVRFSDGFTSDLATLNNSKELRYCHFSVWLSKSRKFCRAVAWNVDGGKLKKLSRSGIDFVKDERGNLETFQIGDELYADNPIDRGHIARRADLCWGVMAEANQANRDSFFFSNITP